MSENLNSAAKFGLRPDLPLVVVSSRSHWRRWLEREHARSKGVWVVTTKKVALSPVDEYVGARDLNEECLCFGWIDSKPGKVDDKQTALLCTPRKPRSGWSKVNKTRIEQLIAAGQMTHAGQQKIDAAKLDGSWKKLDAVDSLEVPTDLKKAFRSYKLAMTNFAAFPPSTRKGILEWIAQAKTDTTRARRVEETARLAEQNVRANQWRPLAK
jgi:uncharacterized protein YdeI (YjbR/CyaY-like superfamily)